MNLYLNRGRETMMGNSLLRRVVSGLSGADAAAFLEGGVSMTQVLGTNVYIGGDVSPDDLPKSGINAVIDMSGQVAFFDDTKYGRWSRCRSLADPIMAKWNLPD